MAKKKTLRKPKQSLKNTLLPYKFDGALFRNHEVVKEILLESLSKGDIETFRDVLIAFLKAQSMTKFSKKSGLGRQTIYDMLKKPKEFDPQVSTVAKIMNALAA